MSNIPVARRYARALVDAAGAQAEAVLGQLETTASFFEAQRELFATLSSPALPRTQRMAVLDAVLTAAPGADVLVQNLLRILAERSRFSLLPIITRQYRELVDVKVGRVRGRLVSAVSLSDSQREAMRKTLEKLTQRSVVLEASVDKNLLGGAVAQLGSLVFDGSLKAQLAELGRTLAKPVTT